MFSLKEQGILTEAQAEIFRCPRPAEALFDVTKDYHQLNNLVDNPKHIKVLNHLRQIMDQWQSQTGDTVPDDPTPDKLDRKTGKVLFKGRIHSRRGTIPGSERNAQNINNPGPR